MEVYFRTKKTQKKIKPLNLLFLLIKMQLKEIYLKTAWLQI